jgi:two-component system, chemotaxis family, protein-glutamate methylesterase/glutaminase
VVIRAVLSQIISEFEEIDEVMVAPSGSVALAKAERARPELITLDIEMPEMDGLEVLDELKRKKIPSAVVVISSKSTKGSKLAIDALQRGAFEVLAKPSGTDAKENKALLKRQLMGVLTAIRVRHGVPVITETKSQRQAQLQRRLAEVQQRMKRLGATAQQPVKIVAIGASTGGPQALYELIPRLPADLPVPVVLVLHMQKEFTPRMAESLDEKSAIRVVETRDGQLAEPGTVYLAPGGQQMKLTRPSPSGPVVLRITDAPPEHHCKPSADYLFRSVADIYGPEALGIIMTGMGNDGAQGLERMKQRHARIVAQDEDSCVVFGMPAAAVEAGVVDAIVALDELSGEIISAVARGLGRAP